MSRKHLIVSFGGGTNSTGMLVGLHERGITPDAIIFADTGGEKPHTYEHIEQVSDWCESVGFPRIEVIRGAKYWTPKMVTDQSLEGECLRLGSLPSKAFGYSQCSVKWKLQPANRWMNHYMQCHGIEKDMITRMVGFDAGERHRYDRAIAILEKNKDLIPQVFPLIDWDWDRDDCVAAIARAGLKQPGKSACFFCPSTTKKEIDQLADTYPDLLTRALEIERRAMSGEGQAGVARCGLGRALIWNEYVRQPKQCDMFSDFGVPEMDCGCID